MGLEGEFAFSKGFFYYLMLKDNDMQRNAGFRGWVVY